MPGINKATILGNVGRDPELRYTGNGDAVLNVSIATSERYKDKHSGEVKEVTEWHNCVAFRKPAEILNEYVKKGSKLYVEGKLKTRKWDREGQTHYSTEIHIETFELLDRPERSKTNAPGPGGRTNEIPEEDDIPF